MELRVEISPAQFYLVRIDEGRAGGGLKPGTRWTATTTAAKGAGASFQVVRQKNGRVGTVEAAQPVPATARQFQAAFTRAVDECLAMPIR